MDFEQVVAEHRGELLAHCYRMLGSPQDAEDALQEALLGAWKGHRGFEGRSSVRTWLYAIATHACLRHARRRYTTPELLPPLDQTDDLGAPDERHPYVEPWAADPEAAYLQRESLELAYVTALQRLPPRQRAVLVLREVLQLSAAEVAAQLGTTPAAVNSALQRARATMGTRSAQQPGLARIGDENLRTLVESFVDAWRNGDPGEIAGALTEDVRFTMPPLPAWFEGRTMVLRFLTERVFATPWRLDPLTVNAQPGFLCRQRLDGDLTPAAVMVLSLREGRVSALDTFVDPEVVGRFARDR